MKNKQLLTGLVIIVVASLGFFGGTKYEQRKVPTLNSRGQLGQGSSRSGAGVPMGNRLGGGQIIGEVLSIDSTSVTLKLSDGSSKIILWGSNTSIVKTIKTGATDIFVGNKISVFGQTNPDGSVTAQNIQLNPQERVSTPSAMPKK